MASWMVASAALGREVPADEPYPHLHQVRSVGRKGCAACAVVAAEDSGPVRRGEGGHECRPAGRETVEPRWTCPDCGAAWRRVDAVKAGVHTRTWERV